MNKALEILKAIVNNDDLFFMCHNNDYINKAIKELEELQDKYNTQQEFIKKFMTDSFNGRSCDGCKYEPIKNDLDKYNLLPDYCRGCIRVASDRWESKE